MAWADELKKLTGEIVHMHEERGDYIHNLKRDIHQKMHIWKTERTTMNAVLWTDLDSWDQTRKRKIAGLKLDTKALLDEFKQKDRKRVEVVNDLRATVQTYLNWKQERTKKIREVDMEKIKESNTQRAQEIMQMLAGFKAERDEAASAWRNLARYKYGFRSEASGKKKKETGNEFSGNSNRENKILKLIKDNPKGISLPEIAYIMGVTFVSINKEMKEFLDTGKIKKEDNKYFLK